MVTLLHYDLLAEFNRQYYKDLLTIAHLKGTQIKIDKLSFPDGGVDDQANFWGYELNKNGVKYLLSSKYKDKDGTFKEIVLSDVLPIFAKNLQKVAYAGIVYYQIKKPVSAKIKPVKYFSFRELVDHLSSIPHSNPRHLKLFWFKELAQNIDRMNMRVSSPPGFGKDSCISILKELLGNCATVENPTISKLEHMSSYKHLAVNEVVGIGGDSWKNIQLYLLAVGAFKTSFTKHSRATETVGEEIDISKLSLSLFYNDIDTYVDEKYFDMSSKGAVCDRFPPIRVYGRFLDSFTRLTPDVAEKTVKENIDFYKNITSTITYYKHNFMSEFHYYEVKNLMKLPQRWQINIETLLRIIDLYCDTQEEFDSWVVTINECVDDYMAMLKFPSLFKKFCISHCGVAKEDLTKQSIREIYEHVVPFIQGKENSIKFINKVMQADTFTQRIKLLENYNEETVKKEEHGFW